MSRKHPPSNTRLLSLAPLSREEIELLAPAIIELVQATLDAEFKNAASVFGRSRKKPKLIPVNEIKSPSGDTENPLYLYEVAKVVEEGQNVAASLVVTGTEVGTCLF